MPKTSRVPFIDQTNTVNMNSAKTGKLNSSKIVTKTRKSARKSKETASGKPAVKGAEKLDKNVKKPTVKSSSTKPPISISNKLIKSDNLPVGKTRLSQRLSKNNAKETTVKTIRKPREKLQSKSSPNKPQTSISKNDSKSPDNKLKHNRRTPIKIPKNNTAVKRVQMNLGKTDPCKSKRPKIISEISKIKNTKIPSQNEDFGKIILNQPKVPLTRCILKTQDTDNENQKVTIDPNLQKNKEQCHLKKQQKLNPHYCIPENSVPSNLKQNNAGVRKSDLIPTQVTISSNLQKEHYGLRKGGKVNIKYNDSEDSVLDSSTEKSNLEKIDSGPIYKKTHSVPIYKNAIPEPEKPQTEDLYEFTDLTPPEAKPAKKKRPHNSSIIFDKNTHEIMQKLEQKEAKAKKKVKPKKKTAKSYDKIVGEIVSNVVQKINKRQQKNPLINKIDQTNIDVSVEFISHVPSTNIHQTQELPSTSTANIPQNVAVRKPVPITVLSNELITKGDARVEIARKVIVSKNLPSTSTANRLQTVEVRKPVPESTVLSNKLLTTSATVPEIEQDLLCASTTNRDQITLDTQVPKTRIDTLRKGLPTTSTPNKTTKLSNNSVNYDDISSCFGFDDDNLLPIANSSNPVDETLGCALEFNSKEPNANSTMVGIQYDSRPSRAEGPRMSYFNCKHNGLPSGNQRIFIDHTIVEAFDRTPSKTPIGQETPSKRPEVQQSILDYVLHSTDRKKTLDSTLYNVKEFKSPKKKETHKENVNVAKRNLLFTNGSPIKRSPLGDISNSSEETTFYTSYPRETKRKTSKNHIPDENAEPFRFNPNLLKVYTKKKSINERQKEPEVDKEATPEDQSISIMENSDENVADVDLFEDPEQVLENMPPVEINLKKSKRKRCSPGGTHWEQKRKAKKAKLDLEAEIWIQQFNDLCQDIEQQVLNIE